MENKKSLYIASAICTALSMAATTGASAAYDASMKHCYGAALAGQNDCKGDVHSCKGQSTEDCNQVDWKMAKSAKQCEEMIHHCHKNRPQKL